MSYLARDEPPYPRMYHHQTQFQRGAGGSRPSYPGYIYPPDGYYSGDGRRPMMKGFRRRSKRRSGLAQLLTPTRQRIVYLVLLLLIIVGVLMIRRSGASGGGGRWLQHGSSNADKSSGSGNQSHTFSPLFSSSSSSKEAALQEKDKKKNKSKDADGKSKGKSPKEGEENKEKKKKGKEDGGGTGSDRNNWMKRTPTLTEKEQVVWNKRVEECRAEAGGAAGDSGRVLVLVTAASSNHYTSLLALWKSFEARVLHKQKDKCTLFLAYDIGLLEENREFLEKGFEDVAKDYTILRQFDFEAYPKHAALKTSSFAWKAFVMNEVAVDFPDAIILWSDSGNVITGAYAIDDLKSLAMTYGLTGTHLDEKVGSMTAPETFDLAIQASTQVRQEISERPMLSGAIIGVDPRNSTVMDHIFRPWVECAAKDGCYNPPGSNKKNHRQDQSALSILYYYSGVVPLEAIPRYQKNKEWLRQDHIGAIAIHADIDPKEKESMEALFRSRILN